MENLLSAMDVEEEPLWFQPTDQLRSVPAEPSSKVLLPNPMQIHSTAFQLTYTTGNPRQLEGRMPIGPIPSQRNRCEDNNDCRIHEAPLLTRACRNVEPLNQIPRMCMVSRSGDKTGMIQPSTWEDCGYCRSVGKPSCGHTKTSCPELFALKPCTLCGADGYDNHTLMHCPSQVKIKLELKEEHLRRMELRQAERMQMRIKQSAQGGAPFSLV